MWFRRLGWVLVVAFLPQAVGAPGTAGAEAAILPARIAAVIDRPEFGSVLWGLHVVSLDTGRVLFDRNGRVPMKPASNVKLFTAALALDRLGPEHRVGTRLLAAGRLDRSGTLAGDLIVSGAGDFSIAARFHHGNYTLALEPFIEALRSAGVRRIRGDVVGDGRRFAGAPFGQGWSWDDLQYYYGAEASALTLEDNTVDLILRPGAVPGEPCSIELLPETGYLQFENRAVTAQAGTAPDIRIQRPLLETSVLVEGHLPAGGSNWLEAVSVPDAPRWFATQLRSELKARGIRVDGRARSAGDRDADARQAGKAQRVELGRVDSPPLKVLLPVAMQTSFNLYSQLLWLQVGDAAAASEPAADAGSTASTTAERALGPLDDFLRVAGVPSSGVRLLEGTGLAEGNMLSAEAIVSLLRFMDRHRDAVLFRASLATAGRDGTLAQRMKGTPAEGNVQAKTGTLSTVHALSGYVRTARGEPLAFAIILNAAHVSREAGRQAVDEVAVVLAGFDGTSGGLAP